VNYLNRFFEVIASLSLAKVAGAGLLFLGMYYSFSYESGEPYETAISKLKRDIATEEKRKKEVDAALKVQEEVKNKVAELSIKYQEASQKLPKELNSFAISKSVQVLAKASGVLIKSMRPDPPVRKDILEEVPFKVSLEGTFPELATFSYYVASMERITKLRDITITEADQATATGKTKSKLKLEAQVVSYRFLGAEEVPALKAKGKSKKAAKKKEAE
jgi:type IV pilus assembly protein PilO